MYIHIELTNEADYLVGSKEAGGLSIEQTKRLSIAVELAASPSIIFLDEPTSGTLKGLIGVFHNVTNQITNTAILSLPCI